MYDIEAKQVFLWDKATFDICHIYYNIQVLDNITF